MADANTDLFRNVTGALFAAFVLLFFSSCGRPIAALSPSYVNPLAAHKFSCLPLDSLTVAAALPVLEAEYGAAIDCPEEYRDKLLAALSFYPDLKGVPVQIVQKRLKTSMAARPAGFALMRRGRHYKIYVDDITRSVSDFRRYPYVAQVGCFLHELGHVAYYENRSNVQLAYDGVNYLTRQRFRNRYEAYADLIIIERGGGYYEYLFRRFTLHEAGISPEYREFKEQNYLTAEKLLELHLAAIRERGAEGAGCE